MIITTINDSNFKDFIENNPKVVVKFVADWCGSCKLFAPKYKRIALNETLSNINFLEINAEENVMTRKFAKVDNLPFIAIFKEGVLVDGRAISLEDKALEFITTTLL